ncbi:hypothetical protein Q3A66_18830 [Hymenobacter sp. BT770]|uniref:DUF5074 domain-containing protein n=1 Tax=Hymenobacter sp. BT770 TaxID=2886942 RepID=UPI001D118DE5|nr:DUF5074 domain-containing protein [Hymenobacter sp. BT770]MCC3155149.1 hypothetical protein [Hymenobacter sp. BT770]MDO3417128.1 hypothetical protein [Hymenobacter sp. BT770]
MKKQFVPFLAALALLAACDPQGTIDTPAPAATTGVFILSEGQFGAGDGAVSVFDKATKAVTLDAFSSANSGAKLGDVVQNMGVQGSRGYIVVNASKKIEVVNLPDFKTAGTITGLDQPRYFTATSATRGYVTEWRGPYTGYLPGVLSILDLSTNTVASRVTVGRNPEQPLALGGKVYVPNSLDNTISVVDEATGTLSSTITVADGPSSMVADKDGNIWVLCSGFVTYLSAPPYTARVSNGALVRFSPNSPATQFKLTFPATSGPSKLRINPAKDQLYYSFGGAEYQLSTTATALPTAPFIRRSFSGFAIDPRDNTVFGGISPSYNSNGRFIRYQASGAAIDSFDVKVGPNGFLFY